jgi:hypothetical protein
MYPRRSCSYIFNLRGNEYHVVPFGSDAGTRTSPRPAFLVPMGRSIAVLPKRTRAGPPIKWGRDPNLPVRVPKEMVAEIEDWANKNETTRSEAVRRLIELGLKAKR